MHPKQGIDGIFAASFARLCMASSAPLHLLLNADVFAPEHLGRRHVLVGGGQVRYISELGDEEKPVVKGPEIEEIDLAGKRLIPGLVDPPVHVTCGGVEA